jgi:hypothetical protein
MMLNAYGVGSRMKTAYGKQTRCLLLVKSASTGSEHARPVVRDEGRGRRLVDIYYATSLTASSFSSA